MTEEMWLAAIDPFALLDVGGLRSRRRKLRLFAVACSRRVWHFSLGERSWNAIVLAERFADAEASLVELDAASQAAREVWDYYRQMDRALDDGTAQASEAVWLAAETIDDYVEQVLCAAREAADYAALGAGKLEPEAQAQMLRHIFGNPFRPHPPLSHIPAVVRQLAEALYQQNDSVNDPLYDGLLDAGLTDLAEHFRDPTEWHPKGCWALDLLLGKE